MSNTQIIKHKHVFYNVNLENTNDTPHIIDIQTDSSDSSFSSGGNSPRASAHTEHKSDLLPHVVKIANTVMMLAENAQKQNTHLQQICKDFQKQK